MKPLQEFTKGEKAKANSEAIVQGGNYRFTILTPQMIRLEYSEDGLFEDRMTQTVWHRQFDVPDYHVYEDENYLEIETEDVLLIYDRQPFSPNGLVVKVKGNYDPYRTVWRFGEPPNALEGTARTLDRTDGAIPLKPGLVSKYGFSVIDDSCTLVLTEDGWVEPRKKGVKDFYFLGYGREYQKCLQDFYKLCGKAPLLPRYTLGNWWSRYHKYDETEYKELINRFEEKRIPFSVAVMDMDWHVVDVDPKYGSGWTGYTWNEELFPNPKEFMNWLHKHHLKVTLNVHPSNGVQPYEKKYQDMVEVLGKDWNSEKSVMFDITDRAFLQAYFEHLHHPNEDIGVDFWWIDWQQESVSRIPGLDPLWMLNHFHYLDSGRRNRRKLTFSRYAGLGSHRYPIGFSGDTVTSWESLAFQPYFTASASNAGYGWWSHDIGGHMRGYKDDELATRWVQFGVFSPISRLHSTRNPFAGKEPWNFNEVSEKIMTEFLQLRHRLIPYLYTMNRYASREGRPLILPMYYEHPYETEAYEVPNQYLFGTELIVCPMTEPIDARALVASFNGWLPPGTWFDFFNGRKYTGGRKLNFYRELYEMPVLAKAGAIVPLAVINDNSVSNPDHLEVKVFAGANGAFQLWEDEGDTLDDKDENWVHTDFSLKWSAKPIFTIKPAQGNTAVIPATRNYTLHFTGISSIKMKITLDGEPLTLTQDIERVEQGFILKLSNIPVSSQVQITFETNAVMKNNVKHDVFDYWNKVQIEYDVKREIYELFDDKLPPAQLIAAIQALHINEKVFGALCEMISAS